MSKPFTKLLCSYQQRINQALGVCLPPDGEPPNRLTAAMAYSINNGGKRVRATLVYASSEALGCCSDDHCPNTQALNQAACAVELIHAYSLIHDDLPAMDNDDLRRGQPTCHIAFDEATAILAGDALQALAFEMLSTITDIDAQTSLNLILTLAQASGHAGMVGGQMLDLQAEQQQLPLNLLEQVHRLKTGALIKASVRLGALITRARKKQSGHFISDESMQRLDDYAGAIGLAFQVMDDILDVEGNTETLGKNAGADQYLHKSTYPALLGLDGAKQKAKELHTIAIKALEPFNEGADPLRQLATFIIERNR